MKLCIGSAIMGQIHTKLRLNTFGVLLKKVAQLFLLRKGFGVDGESIPYFSVKFSPKYFT